MLLGRPLDYAAATRVTDQAIDVTESDVVFLVHDPVSVLVNGATLYDAATGIYTVRIAGVYRCEFNLPFFDVPATTVITARLLAGSQSFYRDRAGMGASLYTDMQLSKEVRLAAGDTIKVRAILTVGPKNIRGSVRPATFDVRLLEK
jgi:hypothetical protein